MDCGLESARSGLPSIDSAPITCTKMQREEVMDWYYEILGRNNLVLERSEALYGSQWEAQWAGYRRFKDKQVVERDLRSVPVTGNIRAKRRDD